MHSLILILLLLEIFKAKGDAEHEGIHEGFDSQARKGTPASAKPGTETSPNCAGHDPVGAAAIRPSHPPCPRAPVLASLESTLVAFHDPLPGRYFP
jgi:hypothetical protein